MKSKSKAPRRKALVLGLGALAVLAAGFWLQRMWQTGQQPSGPATTTIRPARQRPASGGSAQVSFVDPVTGELREPTIEERAALAAAAAAEPAPEPVDTTPFPLAGGGVGMRVPSDADLYMTAAKKADGTISFDHATGARAAEAAVKAKPEPGIVQKKEEPNDR